MVSGRKANPIKEGFSLTYALDFICTKLGLTKVDYSTRPDILRWNSRDNGLKRVHKSKGVRSRLGWEAYLTSMYESNEILPRYKKLTDDDILRQLEIEFPNRIACRKIREGKATVNEYRLRYNRGEYSVDGKAPIIQSVRYAKTGLPLPRPIKGRKPRRQKKPSFDELRRRVQDEIIQLSQRCTELHLYRTSEELTALVSVVSSESAKLTNLSRMGQNNEMGDTSTSRDHAKETEEEEV